jgi:hypothetical protein
VAGVHALAAEATVVIPELLTELISELGQGRAAARGRRAGRRGTGVRGRGAAAGRGRGRGVAELHGVIAAAVTVGVVTGGKGSEAVHHDNVIVAVGQVTYVLPGGALRYFSNQQLLDLGLEAGNEVVAEVIIVAVGQEDNEVLELIGVGFDRGGLTEGTEGFTGFVFGVGITNLCNESVSKLVIGGETGSVLLAVRGTQAFTLKPGLGWAGEETGDVANGVGVLKVEAGHLEDTTGAVSPSANFLNLFAVKGVDGGGLHAAGQHASATLSSGLGIRGRGKSTSSGSTQSGEHDGQECGCQDVHVDLWGCRLLVLGLGLRLGRGRRHGGLMGNLVSHVETRL